MTDKEPRWRRGALAVIAAVAAALSVCAAISPASASPPPHAVPVAIVRPTQFIRPLTAAPSPGRRGSGTPLVPAHSHPGGHLVFQASRGLPVRVPEPMEKFAGRMVPQGSCAAPEGSTVAVLPCSSAAVRAWQAQHPLAVAVRSLSGWWHRVEVRYSGAVALGFLTVATWAMVGLAALVGWTGARRRGST
jgi:hypothetical protein